MAHEQHTPIGCERLRKPSLMERHPNDARMPDDLEPASTSKLHTDTAKELTVPIEAKDAYDSSVHSTAPLRHVPPSLRSSFGDLKLQCSREACRLCALQ
jgi:hypothetical protein